MGEARSELPPLANATLSMGAVDSQSGGISPILELLDVRRREAGGGCEGLSCSTASRDHNPWKLGS